MDSRGQSQDLTQRPRPQHSLNITEDLVENELKLNEEEMHVQPSHLHQTQKYEKEYLDSALAQEQHDKQDKCTSLEIQQQQSGEAQNIQEKQKSQSHELQTLESREHEIEVKHEPEVQFKQHQALGSQELQNQDYQIAKTVSRQTSQSQQISTSAQILKPFLSLEPCLEKQPIQHKIEFKNHQNQEKKSHHCHQQHQLKKMKKKIVGENQERINYLVQASKTVALTSRFSTSAQSQKALGAQLGDLASAVARRCVLRLAPGLKRCLCKGCGTALVYGVNAKVRHRSNRQKHLVVTCLTCHTIKRFLNNPRHQLWFEKEEALV